MLAYLHFLRLRPTTYTKRRNMLGLLPFDQLFDIISRLRRNDVLECMCVSRQWHQAVPDYASECFRQVKLDTKRDDLDYSRLLERVGCYVNVVVFENFPAWKGKASKVASLLPILCPNIHTLHLYHSFIDKRFGTYLGKYLAQLPRFIHLAITRPAGAPSPSSKFIRAILAYSPRLISISLTRDARPGALPRDLSLLHARLSFSISLRHLDMADFFTHIHSLEPVLRNCPNLRSLVVYMGAEDLQQEMAILARWCPRIRHLYFPSKYNKGPIHITPAYYAEDDDDDDDDDDSATTASKAISLRSLWIQCKMAQHFLDQKRIKYLHLDYYSLFGYIPSTPPSSVHTLFRQNSSTLESVDLQFDTETLHTFIKSFVSMGNLKLVRLTFNCLGAGFRDYQAAIAMLEELGGVASSHAGIKSVSLAATFTSLNSALMSVMAQIPHLRQIEVYTPMIDSSLFALLCKHASDLETMKLWGCPLNLTEDMFFLLARKRLHHLHFRSSSLPPSTMSGKGLRYLIDQCEGSLDTMAIMGTIQPDDGGACIDYARRKLGSRFKRSRDRRLRAFI